MEFDLERRTAALSVGELSTFTLGPRAGGEGGGGLWRAQLGTQWHQELRVQTAAVEPAAEFECAVEGRIFHQGWTVSLTGRIDQVLPLAGGGALLREIKTVTRALPAGEEELRAAYPDYFTQLATYAALRRIAAPEQQVRGELFFVEVGSGLAQAVALVAHDELAFRVRLAEVVEFLETRHRARERLRGLRFRPAFATPRKGQETTRAELAAALERSRFALFAAPTGFGKTGVLLECALETLRAGRFSRAIYLTGKATGQLQVMQTLDAMTAAAPGEGSERSRALAAWLVRPKSEHCVNSVYHCVRDACRYLDGMAERWPRSGLSRFYLLENQPRDLASVRAAGREASICPYEITRAALAFNEVWIGDYNYVFAPANRRLFFERPGFLPAETLLLIDEAHNLPARVADAHSHRVAALDAQALLAELEDQAAAAPLRRAWRAYAQLLLELRPTDALDAGAEDDLTDVLKTVAQQVNASPVDHAALGPHFSQQLWQAVELEAWLREGDFPRLLWSPVAGELAFTCLDAAGPLGAALREFGGAVFASATPGPAEALLAACGLGGETADQVAAVTAHTPWRDGAYELAYDIRVDTTYRARARHYETTAATVAALCAAATGPVAVFFPSHAYAEAIEGSLRREFPAVRAARQPRAMDLAAQSAWVEESLVLADALFLVLGSSFAEGIDLLGGRVGCAMVVGPALPEVNPVQRARQAVLEREGLTRAAAFERVYQVPGMARVNQAIGRLVRAPGQRAKVLLHCRRFVELSYARLLDRDYQFGATIATDAKLAEWLEKKS